MKPEDVTKRSIKIWLTKYMSTADVEKVTVNTTVQACGEKFGCDMTGRKKEIKSLLISMI